LEESIIRNEIQQGSLELHAMRTALAALLVTLCACASAADKPRARALGIPFDGTPGALNAITDVAPVAVGYTTLIAGSGEHAVRTGVTAILPRGAGTLDKPVFAGVFSLNGNGEMTGTHWIEESGFLEGPVMITGTHSVGTVRDAVIAWRIRQGKPDASGYWWSLPVVAETWDGELSDANGFHVKAGHVFAALDAARSGAIAEGNVGGGTAMICHELKGGTGTSSRIVEIEGRRYTVGTLVQANYGVRSELRIAGVPVGKFMPTPQPEAADQGSIIVVVASDAPLLPQQLERLARRAALGLARTGSYSGDGSGDLFLAFSTANDSASQVRSFELRALANGQLNPLFLATVQSVEESIVNALVAAETMTGVNGTTVKAIDTGELRKILQRFGRLTP
jgi:D-aminopeptidase